MEEGRLIHSVPKLSEGTWQKLHKEHQEILRPYVEDRLHRMAQHQKHPIRDFLFEYYSFRPAHLMRWSPGVNVLLEGAKRKDLSWQQFVETPEGAILPPESYPENRRPFVIWALDYLEAVARRPPQFGCFGLHEWAMVYKTQDIRHQSTPLRLSSEKISEIVEAEGTRCTHYDAYRFFTEAARPLNRLRLTRDETDQHDQRGCVHVTMDLYRFAFKISPYCPAELLREAFLLAWQARELDMRASPYDLRAYGLQPIPIETRTGREQYIEQQRQLSELGQPIRERLIEVYRVLKGAFSHS